MAVRYLIKKGEEPAKDRSNIFAWTPFLAKRTDEFEPFKGSLPGNEPRRARPPRVDPVPILPDEQKILLIVEKMDTFTSEQQTADGLPRLDELEKALNFTVTGDMRLKALDVATAAAEEPEAPALPPEEDEEEVEVDETDGDSSEAGVDDNEEDDQEE